MKLFHIVRFRTNKAIGEFLVQISPEMAEDMFISATKSGITVAELVRTQNDPSFTPMRPTNDLRDLAEVLGVSVEKLMNDPAHFREAAWKKYTERYL